MKNIGFILIPVLVILMGTTVVPRLFASGVNPLTLILVSIGLIAVTSLLRPKKAAPKSTQQVADEIMDDYCADAFADNEALGRKFQSALSDIGNNLPKSAANKLKKMAEECVTDPQKYAVALATARAYRLSQDYKNVIREYNKAIVLHPTDFLAYQIGDCHQRLGNLDKALDSYQFAAELDPTNPQYPSSMGTACVGSGDYNAAIGYAQDALELDEAFPQALATLAICYGMKNDSVMHSYYLKLAGENGYSRDKIETTVKELKKRER